MATMHDVAAMASVSVSTVSHVLNGTRKVSAETRERVEAAVRELGYRWNTAARILAGGRSNTIGLVTSGLTNAYFGPLLHTIEQEISRAGSVLILSESHDEGAMEQRMVESLLDRSVDGLIVAPSPGFEAGAAPVIQASGTPVVLIDRGSRALECDQVVPDNTQPARRLTEHLLDRGHRRIGAVGGLLGLDSSSQRVDGYLQALAARGIEADPELLVLGHSSSEGAFRAVRSLLALREPPTAVITLNNAMTIGAVRATRELGLRIPEDVALVGYDDFEWSDLFEPRLTAVAQNVEEMGRIAVELLLRRIEDPERTESRAPERCVVPTSFHHRTSCGCERVMPLT